MPFTGVFTIAPAAGFNVFTLTDASDYTDEPKNTFSGRRIRLIKTNLATLVPDGTTTSYIDFPYAGGDTITINALTRDYALNVVADWISVDPQSGSTYQASLICSFLSYNTNNEYGIIQALTAKPSCIYDINYWANLGIVQTEKANAIWATYYQEQRSAQWAINRSALLLSNPVINF